MTLNFKTVNEKDFLNLSIILCLICDILGSFYIIFQFLPKRLKSMVAQQLAAQGRINMLDEMMPIMIMSVNILIILFIFFHIIVYFFANKNKQWAINYMGTFAIAGIVLGLIMTIEAFKDGIIWMGLNLITTYLYFLIYKYIKAYKMKYQES